MKNIMKEEEILSFHTELNNSRSISSSNSNNNIIHPNEEPPQSHEMKSHSPLKDFTRIEATIVEENNNNNNNSLKCNHGDNISSESSILEQKNNILLLASSKIKSNNNNNHNDNTICFVDTETISMSAPSCQSSSSSSSSSSRASSCCYSAASPRPHSLSPQQNHHHHHLLTPTTTTTETKQLNPLPTTQPSASDIMKHLANNSSSSLIGDEMDIDDEEKKTWPQKIVEQKEANDKQQQQEEGVIELRFLVRRREAGALIGKRGVHIKHLRETFRSSMFSIPDTGNGPERVVCITTNEQFVDPILTDLTQLLMEKSQENDEQIELKLLIHSSNAGSLIGIGGQSIKKLRNDSKAAIKIYEMCCPLSNERVCAIKARPPVVVSTIKLIQTILKENPIKGTTKPYDALHFDLNLADKYGGYFPDDTNPISCIQQQQQAANLPLSNIILRHPRDPNLVYNQHHQQQHHHYLQSHPRNQPPILLHSMKLNNNNNKGAGISYQDSHCSVWRAPNRRNVAGTNDKNTNTNNNSISSACFQAESNLTQDLTKCTDSCKQSLAQLTPLRPLPGYLQHHRQTNQKLISRFHPYATTGAGGTSSFNTICNNNNKHLYAARHHQNYPLYGRFRPPFHPVSPALFRQQQLCQNQSTYQTAAHYPFREPATTSSIPPHHHFMMRFPSSFQQQQQNPAIFHQPAAGLFHHDQHEPGIVTENHQVINSLDELRCQRHLRPSCLCMFFSGMNSDALAATTTNTPINHHLSDVNPHTSLSHLVRSYNGAAAATTTTSSNGSAYYKNSSNPVSQQQQQHQRSVTSKSSQIGVETGCTQVGKGASSSTNGSVSEIGGGSSSSSSISNGTTTTADGASTKK